MIETQVQPGTLCAVIPPWCGDVDRADSFSFSSTALRTPRQSWQLSELRDNQVPSSQRRLCEELERVGLSNKSRRNRVCGLIAKKRICDGCGQRFFVRFSCGNRYCPVCARKIFERLFGGYCGILLPVVRRLVPEWPVCGRRPERVIAKVDITLRGSGRMPSPKDVSRFNQQVKKLFRELERRYCAAPVRVGYRIAAPKDENGKPRKCTERLPADAGFEARLAFAVRNGGVVRFLNEVERSAVECAFRAAGRRFWKIFGHDFGFLYCDEFGGASRRPGVNRGLGNTNLHAHGVWAGPWLPQRELSALWREISGGSFIVYIQVARSPQAAIAHALKYAGKFLSQDPARLAQLEATFNGARRVHTLGAFYDAGVDGTEEPQSDPLCPCGCGGHLLREGDDFESVFDLIPRGYRDLDQARREMGRARIFSGAGPP